MMWIYLDWYKYSQYRHRCFGCVPKKSRGRCRNMLETSLAPSDWVSDLDARAFCLKRTWRETFTSSEDTDFWSLRVEITLLGIIVANGWDLISSNYSRQACNHAGSCEIGFLYTPVDPIRSLSGKGSRIHIMYPNGCYMQNIHLLYTCIVLIVNMIWCNNMTAVPNPHSQPHAAHLFLLSFLAWRCQIIHSSNCTCNFQLVKRTQSPLLLVKIRTFCQRNSW